MPRVVVHNAVSADGRIDGFTPDIGLFYTLAGSFAEDATLSGADTILAAGLDPAVGAETVAGEPPADGPLLAVTDSRGRIESWDALRRAGIWRGVLSLCTHTTPPSHLDRLTAAGVPYAVCGRDRVDIRAALALLASEHGVRTVRVDSGGRLNGALLRAGLVDEISLLVHPVVVGGRSAKSAFVADDLSPGSPGVALSDARAETVGDGLLWLRWEVARSSAAGQE